VKEVPLFLIAHNNLAKTNGNFILCTKKPSFLSKLVHFNNQEALDIHLKLTSKQYQIVPNTTDILEIVDFLDTPPVDISTIANTFKRMAHWYAHHGETSA
jgi:hypothetical protein